MASTARLDRLRQIVQPDIDALPERPLELIDSDTDDSGGVALEPANTPNKQTAADHVQPQPHPQPTPQPNTDRRYIWLQNASSSYNPTPMTTPTTLPQPPATLPPTVVNRGDLAPAQQHFTPIQALAKYPYKYCNRIHSQDIASAFFDQGKFWAREWDLYYLWDIDNLSKPLILVGEVQFQTLLDDINKHLNLGLRITDQQREEALVSRFPDHPRCTPRYLGRSKSRDDYDTMVDNTPAHDFRARGEPEHPPLDEHSLEAFKHLMEESFEAQKAKNKAAKAKKQQERMIKQKTMADQFKRAQRYLGLRPTPATQATPTSGSAAAIDPTLPAPFDLDQNVVFVCVDVESYERAHHKITEVGIATLDTRELMGVPPGQDGENWRSLIRARHFRIKEHAHLVNSEFVSGYPEGFDFGTSTVVSLADAPAHVASCFAPPFGAHHSNGVENIADFLKAIDFNEKRNIIFLGHDTLGDVRYLQNLGYDPMKVDNLLEALDTAVMYRVWRRELNPTSLGRILYDFDIAGYKLHNAGNDAVYTVQAMLGICVREASIRGSPELDNIRDSEKSARLAVALLEAQQKANDEAEGWSDHEAEGDGGAPVPIAVSPPKPAPASMASQLPSNSNGRGAFRGRGGGRGGSQHTLYNPNKTSSGYGNASGGYRGDRGPSSGLRSYTRGGHIGGQDRQGGKGRGDGNHRGRGDGTHRGRGDSKHHGREDSNLRERGRGRGSNVAPEHRASGSVDLN